MQRNCFYFFFHKKKKLCMMPFRVMYSNKCFKFSYIGCYDKILVKSHSFINFIEKWLLCFSRVGKEIYLSKLYLMVLYAIQLSPHPYNSYVYKCWHRPTTTYWPPSIPKPPPLFLVLTHWCAISTRCGVFVILNR